MDFSSTWNKIILTQEEFENNPRWEAHLNNGLIVYSDSTYIEGRSDWDRLHSYCKTNNLKIDIFCIAFRDHKVFLDKGNGYYFRRMHLSNFGGGSKEYFVVGSGSFPEIIVYKYSLPELILFESEPRIVKEEDLI